MNPTPEQLAFAFAMISLRNRPQDNPAVLDDSLSLWSSVFRIAAIAVIGLSTGLMGLSYLENRVATGGRTDAELQALTAPSIDFHSVVEKTSAIETDLQSTAAAE